MQLSGKKHTPAVCTLFTSLWCGARPKLSGSLIAKVSTCIKASLAGFSAPVYPGIANMKVENIEILHQPYALWLNKEIFREDFCEIAADQQVIIHSWSDLSHSSMNLLCEAWIWDDGKCWIKPLCQTFSLELNYPDKLWKSILKERTVTKSYSDNDWISLDIWIFSNFGYLQF